MKLIISQKASNQLDDLFYFLENKWSSKTRWDFQEKLTRSIKAIKMMPKAFPKSDFYPNCRKCVVTQQITLIYEIEKETIVILVVFDNRSDFENS
jgi:plasmid stabilization system protein ParE